MGMYRKIYKAKGLKPTKLSDCCRTMKIQLNHHEALSDARACPIVFEVVLEIELEI
jgi:DNA polymerase III epsilon subunit-like protein